MIKPNWITWSPKQQLGWDIEVPPAFLEAFTDKGRMRPLLEAMPVKVIIKDAAALLGAPRVAAMN